MDHFNEIPTLRLSSVSFRQYTAAEIKALSVLEVTNPQTFDILSHPTYGGLHDPALGPSNRSEVCITCGLSHVFCPGHVGYIQLPLPVFHPVYFMTMYKLLKGTCFDCHKLVIDAFSCHVFIKQMRLLNKGDVVGCYMVGSYAEYLSAERGKKSYELTRLLDSYIADNFSGRSDQLDLVNFKNIQAVRTVLINSMLERLVKRTKCPHCDVTLRKLHQQYNRSIRLYGRSSKAAKSKQSSKSKSQPSLESEAKENEDDEREADVEDIAVEDSQEKLKTIFTESETFTNLTPALVREHIREVWKTAGPVLKHLFESLATVSEGSHPTDIFFLEVLPVCPTRYRPIAFLKGRQYENPQTAILGNIVEDKVTIINIITELKKRKPSKDDTDFGNDSEMLPENVLAIQGKSLSQKLNNAWLKLQTDVNCSVDSKLDKLSQTQNVGIKQMLEKKHGLFRMNMMGKRVNFAARSVISPDPCIGVNEIGVPLVFAKRLTYPQKITPWNFQELRQMVINGPDTHPGALMVEMENGQRIHLNNNKKHCEAIAKQLLTPSTASSKLQKPKTVYRHLKNGDYMLLNRQPTLHKPSMQAHRVRVLQGQKTLRLHYANCKAYNADFDGDEMNAHFPQNEIGRAEAMAIASTDNQYLVPKDGTPLAGLIQDHMVSGVSLTIRGRFLSKADYFQLLYGALTDLPGPVKSLPPTIIKPYPLWSGKQLVSSVLVNIIPAGQAPLNLDGKSKIPEKNWLRGSSTVQQNINDMGESKVVIRDGQLLQGVLDKAHYGPTSYSLVHTCYELYGGQTAGKLLGCLGKLFRLFLQYRGFTLGVEDILVQPSADKNRRKIMKKSAHCGEEAIQQFFHLDDEDATKEALSERMREAHFSSGTSLQEHDLAMKVKTDVIQNDIVKECIPKGLHKLFPDNNLQLMVEAGAKGSSVNCMQISCLLGQIELEGRRPPLMISGRSLPSFCPYDAAPRAGGFVAGRFLTGIKAPEYFFHCMAGREGLVDTAVKTSRSGYLQRCIIKHLEGVQVAYDMTVRDSDGSVVQFSYGEDGLESSRIPFLTPKQFPFWAWNGHLSDREEEEEDEKTRSKIKRQRKKIKTWKKQHSSGSKVRCSGYLEFCREEMDDGDWDVSTMGENGRTDTSASLEKLWRALDEDRKNRYTKQLYRCPDPLVSKFHPLHHTSVLAEKLNESLDTFCEDELKQVVKSLPKSKQVTSKCFRKRFTDRVLRAYAQPGEMVGLICAQSIGEPSTQMTLNTFHFAGRGEMNVTLGIPRLKEILQTANPNIKTPAMDIPVLPGALEKARELKVKLAKVTLSEILKEVQVAEFISSPKPKLAKRNFRVRFSFLPEEMYKGSHCVCPEDILVYMERTYLSQLLALLKRKIRLSSTAKSVSMGQRVRTADGRDGEAGGEDLDEGRVVERDADDSDEDPNDGDAVTEKELAQQTDDRDYDDMEQEEEEVSEASDMEDVESGDRSKDDVQFELADAGSPTEEVHSPKAGRKSFKKRIPSAAVLNPNITEYKFDKKEGLWCEAVYTFDLYKSKMDVLTVVERTLKTAVVHQVKGIKQTFLVEEKGEAGPEWHLKTEGVNIEEMYKYADILDINRLYTNNIFAFADIYGIEAASRILLKEISSVFGGYGINVDYRHLSLLADYMTFEGVCKGMNRYAINSNVAPFQKMTFESCMKFLTEVSLSGHQDTLKSPSSCLVTGQVLKCGTGMFEILQSLV